MDCTFANAKKSKSDKKKGYNIVNEIDIGVVVSEFINYYYTNVSNIQTLIDFKIIREYTSIKFGSDKLQGDKLIEFLQKMSEYKMDIKDYNYLDSGSRRIDIVVIGTLTNKTEVNNFNQTFVLCHQDNVWYIKNSIFMII